MKEIEGVVDITETENYDSYEGQGGGGGSSELSKLSDVAITNPDTGQILAYNDETEKWENIDLSLYDIVLELGLEEGDVTSVTQIYMNENAVVQKAQQGKIVNSFVYATDEYNNLKAFRGWGSGVIYELEEGGVMHSLSVYATPYGFTQPTYFGYDPSNNEWFLD